MRLVIFGAGDFAEICHHYFTRYTEHQVEGFVVDDDYHTRSHLLDLPVLPASDGLTTWPPGTHEVFVAIGYGGGNLHRQAKCQELRARGYRLASFIHPTAVADGLSMGDNCLVSEHAVVQPYSQLGDGVIVRAGSIIGHHATVGSYCYVAPGVTMGGGCRIGRRVFLGLGVLVRDRILVADDVEVGMGGVVTKTADRPGLYMGCPARHVPGRREPSPG
ncbi:NeuD/PglB/VioB family sugar acetyltransferase [Phenylobacterium sp.]|uniref:NeuD/PglB/VioB family sugar acetyltransferase n=1 Tax=Phenylobacterium sp. TaxID=1871053 RepID=UPI002FC87A54